MTAVGPPPDPLARRQRHLVVALRAATVVAVVLAAGALVLPDRWGERAGTAMVGVLIGAPVLRVAWLTVRWVRRGDVRFALTGVALLVVIAVAALAG
ncbi:MAG TPA: hypothetical protein VK866_09640 [Acidimicrobiales bacterium]|nr:hypothetical protein [Acidimicrobiales bacterium]